MVSGINNIEQSFFQPKLYKEQFSKADTPVTSTNFNSFDDEDQAIISTEAILNNELEQFNASGDNAVELAIVGVLAKTAVAANVNVINTKKEMFDTILEMGK